MKIALVSYEYPPDTALGGIATYMLHVARMLVNRGHLVEVFAAGPGQGGTSQTDGIVVHRVDEKSRAVFPFAVAPIVAQRHAVVGFDVVEAPEYYADAAGVIQLIPEMPLVVKLHTPSFILWRLTFGHSRWLKARNFFAMLKRHELPSYHPNQGPERACTLQADEITAPCDDIAREVGAAWNLPADRLAVLPNLYEPSETLLNIDPKTATNVVTFIGRLEMRKGVIDLADAIPMVLKNRPTTQFRFVGRSVELRPGVEMIDHLKSKLARHQDSVRFTGPVNLDEIPRILGETDIAVFPSLWENFPNTCLEAMSAARGVIGSRAGGMRQMLDDGAAGVLVSPNSPPELAKSIIGLIDNPKRRIELGIRARARVLSEYNAQHIGKLQEESYARAIARRRVAGPRPQNQDLLRKRTG
jgi:glycogen synthase